MGEDGDFVDTMDTWLQARLEALHTTLPGKIQTYDPKTRTATVVPGVRLRSMHGDLIEIKPIAGVPVVWPGSKRFSVIPATLEAGDGVLLHFSESALGTWLNGSDIHDPEDETRFSLHDCIAVPGLWQIPQAPSDQDPGGADFGLVGASGEVLGGKGGKLDLHNGTTDLRTEMDKMWAALIALEQSILTNFTTLTAAATGPLATLNPGFAAMVSDSTAVLLPTALPKDKADLKGLLA